MNLAGEVAAAVHERAADRCQYCRMHQCLQGATFHLEHIIPRSKGGPDELANRTLACPSCNLHKADRTTATDPASGQQVPLFHPTRQIWRDHFRFNGFLIEGLTSTGRATVAALQFNHTRRQHTRSLASQVSLSSLCPRVKRRASPPPEPRQFLVDQAVEFAGFGELLRLLCGFVEHGPEFAAKER